MFENFIEIQQFGFNWPTSIFLTTLFFTFLQGYSLSRQNKAIIKSESGETVSFIFSSFYGFSALAVIIYGINKNSLALTLNGFVGFIMMFVIFNLLRFKYITNIEKTAGLASSIVIPLIILVEDKDLLFLLFGFIVQIALFMQILELINKKKVGSFKPHQAIVSMFSGCFWLLYSLVMNIWPLVIVNISGMTLWAVTLSLYFKYNKIKPR